MWDTIRQLLQQVLARLPGVFTVSGGGILGLALWLGATYVFRRQRHRFQEHQIQRQSADTSQGCNIDGGLEPKINVTTTKEESKMKSLASSLSRNNVSTIALSVTGVMTRERSAAELSRKGATLIESSIEVLRELVISMRKKVFLVCEVEDDIGEAVILDLLDHAGLIGNQMIPNHRVIFCSSNNSKVSIVRQLEPNLYVDVDAEVCKELGRFMNSIVLLQENVSLEEKLSSI